MENNPSPPCLFHASHAFHLNPGPSHLPPSVSLFAGAFYWSISILDFRHPFCMLAKMALLNRNEIICLLSHAFSHSYPIASQAETKLLALDYKTQHCWVWSQTPFHVTNPLAHGSSHQLARDFTTLVCFSSVASPSLCVTWPFLSLRT